MLHNEAAIIKRIPINSELDVIIARLRAREAAREIGFGTIDQARVSLAASELARLLTQTLSAEAEILVSDIRANGNLGIALMSLIPPSIDSLNGDPLDEPTCFSSVIALMDDGRIETNNGRATRITLMKWL